MIVEGIQETSKLCDSCYASNNCSVKEMVKRGEIPDQAIPRDGACLPFFCCKMCIAVRKTTLKICYIPTPDNSNEIATRVQVSCEPLEKPIENPRFWTMMSNARPESLQVIIPPFCPLANKFNR